MAGFNPAIDRYGIAVATDRIAGTSPAMTEDCVFRRVLLSVIP
jgi:hypothetical protein